MKYLLGIDEEYIKGVAVTTEGPSRTHVVFHAVSYGAGDIVTNYESFEVKMSTHEMKQLWSVKNKPYLLNSVEHP